MDTPEYALIVRRFQPFSERHREEIEAARQKGLQPIIVVRSVNNSDHPSYNPLKTPLTLEQQVEDIKRALPPESRPVIIPIADLDAQKPWAQVLLNKLDDVPFLQKCGLDVKEGIRNKTVMLTRPEQHVSSSGERAPYATPPILRQIAELGLPTMDYNPAPIKVLPWQHLMTAELATTTGQDRAESDALPFSNGEYLRELAIKARDANPDKELLEEKHIPVTLFDLTLDRVHKEAGIRTRQIVGLCQKQEGRVDIQKCVSTLDGILQKQRDLNHMKSVFDFGTEFYDPKGVSLQEFLFHPATLAVVSAYGKEALQALVPQKGFDQFIPAMQTYIERMKLSMPDKVDYLKHIEDAGIVVDFGCADGTMLKYLKAKNPDLVCIGYDISEPMLAVAKKDHMGVEFSNNWQHTLELVKQARHEHKGKSVLVLSSLIHEIYAYLPPKERKEFWDKVWDSGFDYVAIRDMMVSTKTDRPSDPYAVSKVRANYDPGKIEEWEQHWGSLDNNRSLVHFLLTSPYKENWAREMREDYLPFNLEDFLTSVPKSYELKYLDHHRHAYTADRIKREFDGLELPDNTHVKMILTRRANPDEAIKKI